MAQTRRKFDQDFRECAVRLVRETGKPIAQVARDLGINEGTLGNWVNADKRRRGGGTGALDEDERPELAMEHDVLKRSVARGGTPDSGSGSDKKWHILKTAFGTWPGRIATVGGMVLAAVIWLVIDLAVDDVHTGAVNEVLRGQINHLQNEITSWQSKVRSLESSKTTLQRSHTELCNIVKSAALSGQFSPPGQAESICGFVVPLVVVTRPQAGASVPMATEVSGTADVKRLNGRTIWFGVTTPGIAGFFIEGNWQTKSGPATFAAGGKWTSPGIFVGHANERGKSFDIVVILADKSAANALWNYLHRGQRTGSFPPIALPAGAQKYLVVNVVRK